MSAQAFAPTAVVFRHLGGVEHYWDGQFPSVHRVCPASNTFDLPRLEPVPSSVVSWKLREYNPIMDRASAFI